MTKGLQVFYFVACSLLGTAVLVALLAAFLAQDGLGGTDWAVLIPVAVVLVACDLALLVVRRRSGNSLWTVAGTIAQAIRTREQR